MHGGGPVASMTTWSEVYDEFMDKYHYQGKTFQGWNNDDDALGTILQALDDLKEGSNHLNPSLRTYQVG